MKLLISFALFALATHCSARDLLESISNPFDAISRPIKSISDDIKSLSVPRKEGTDDAATRIGTSSSKNAFASGANRLRDSISSAVKNPFGTAANFGEDVSKTIGNLFEGSLPSPTRSISSGLKSLDIGQRNAAERTKTAGGSSGSESSTASGTNRLSDTINSAVTNPLGAAANFGRDVSKTIGTLLEKSPIQSISSGINGLNILQRASPQDTSNASGTSGSGNNTTSGTNRFSEAVSNLVTNPFGAATNFSENVSNSIGTLFENSIGTVANISRGIANTLGVNSTIRSPNITQSIQNAFGAAANVSKGIREAVGSFVSNSTGMASNIGKDIASMVGGLSFMNRELSNRIPNSLKDSTGSVRDAVKRLDETLKQGSTLGILFAAGSLDVEIFAQLMAGQLELADAMTKISDVGNAVSKALLDNLMKGIFSSSLTDLMPRFNAGLFQIPFGART